MSIDNSPHFMRQTQLLRSSVGCSNPYPVFVQSKTRGRLTYLHTPTANSYGLQYSYTTLNTTSLHASGSKGNFCLSSSKLSIGKPHVKFSQILMFSLRSPPSFSSSSMRLRTLPLSFAMPRGGFDGLTWMSTRFGMNVDRMSLRNGESDELPS